TGASRRTSRPTGPSACRGPDRRRTPATAPPTTVAHPARAGGCCSTTSTCLTSSRMDPEAARSAAPADGDARSAELADNLARLRVRIAEACARAGRDPSTVTLVAVTKTFPAADIVRLARLGV